MLQPYVNLPLDNLQKNCDFPLLQEENMNTFVPET